MPRPKRRHLCDFEVVTDLTPESSVRAKDLMVKCPPGKTVIGGGARVFGTLTANNRVVLSISGFEPPSLDAPAGWYASAQDVGPGPGGQWGLRVDLFCAAEVEE